MTVPVTIRFHDVDPEAIARAPGRVALIVAPDGRLDPAGRSVNGLTRKALARLVASDHWAGLAPGDLVELGWPGGMAAEALLVVKLPRRPDAAQARAAGAAIARARGQGDLLVLTGPVEAAAQIAMGLALRAYDFDAYRGTPSGPPARVTMMVPDPQAVARDTVPLAALVEGVFFTRDLVNEPANVLTTNDFAARLAAMQEIGLDVEILEEDALRDLGMGALLAVAQGSDSPARVVVMRWSGDAPDVPPLALLGKGVVFDSGGISLKPGAGMEEMTTDMAGAGVVAGVMRTLALRRAKANVVGIVGLVENMPSGGATRPGDIVRAMKGDSIEVINTDAEGRLVLADLLWFAQDRVKPKAMIDLATLTGAIVVALGHENAGIFSNDDALAEALLRAAAGEGEGAWRMPMGPAYDALLKSRLADMKNTGGRAAGAISAAQFLRRFVAGDMPWCHVDIAGVALSDKDTPFAPKGATGWGVRLLDRLIAERFES